jgi:CheY-like chemotaxis protein
MGGKLYFESPPPKEFAQKGTVFFLELCFPLVEIVNTNMKNPNQELLSLQKVLIIDDDEVNLFVLSKYMEFFQISFQAENNPLQALEKARQEKFTIILVDIEMPKMNGLEFINQLQSQEGPSKNAKFIIISGHDQSRINLLPNRSKFLTKPIKKDVLYETLLELSNAS